VIAVARRRRGRTLNKLGLSDTNAEDDSSLVAMQPSELALPETQRCSAGAHCLRGALTGVNHLGYKIIIRAPDDECREAPMPQLPIDTGAIPQLGAREFCKATRCTLPLDAVEPYL